MSLFDGPQGPPEPLPQPPRKAARKPRKAKVPVNGDADLDARLAEFTPDVIDPGYDAHMMRVGGMSWVDIAKKIGSPTPTAAMFTARRYLQEAARAQSAEHLQEALQTQVDRYETILRHWWSLATDGHDEKAATVVLRALERLDRILRLTESDVVVSRETIVVSANPEEYIKQLQEVVADRNGHVNGQPDGQQN